MEIANNEVTDENERLRAHYEVLKEHELNIIRDYEAKLLQNQVFFDSNMQDMQVQSEGDYVRARDADFLLT